MASEIIAELSLISSHVSDETQNHVSVKAKVDEALKRIGSLVKNGIKAMREIVVAVLKWILSGLKRVGDFMKKSCAWFKRFSDNFDESVKEDIAKLTNGFFEGMEKIYNLVIYLINRFSHSDHQETDSTPPPHFCDHQGTNDSTPPTSIWACLKLMISRQFKQVPLILEKFKDVMSKAMVAVSRRKKTEDPIAFLKDALVILDFMLKIIWPIIFFCFCNLCELLTLVNNFKNE